MFNVHGELKPFQCSTCENAFPTNADLQRNVRREKKEWAYISQLIRFARVLSDVADFNARNKSLTAKLLQQGHRYRKLRKTFSQFFRRHYESVFKFNVGLKTLLHQRLSEPEFYRDML